MKRTTIVLTDELAMLLERERRRRGVSAAVVVRDALASYFGHRAEPFAIVGLGQSGHEHTARDAEAIIAREWTYERLMGVPDKGRPSDLDPEAIDPAIPGPSPGAERLAPD